MENGVTSCVRSTIRKSGAIVYITPLHRATESSTTPKSLMNTTVGGGVAVCATRLLAPLQTKKTNRSKKLYDSTAFHDLTHSHLPCTVIMSTTLLEFIEDAKPTARISTRLPMMGVPRL